jgi:DNA-directed RNA polymerase specialized sigma subunit
VIRSEAEYREALKRLRNDREFAAQQRAALVSKGLPTEQVDRAMEPLLSFQAQLNDEVAWYERARRGDLQHISRLADLGRLLIAARIAAGLTQRQLADLLGVSEAQVSRDERNEYHGITVERAQRTLDALGATVTIGIREPPTGRDRPVPTRAS